MEDTSTTAGISTVSDSTGKFCTHCKWCAAHPELLTAGQDRLEQYSCYHPKNIYGYSLVDGSPQFRALYCKDLRSDSMCTRDGNWWEIKLASIPTKSASNSTVGNSDYDLPAIDKDAVAAKIAAAKAARTSGAKPATNLLTDLGL